MRTLKYKTNIKCGGCKTQVAFFLDEIDGIREWEVDIINEDNILTLYVEDLLNESIVVSAVEEAGFEIIPLEIERIQRSFSLQK